MQIQKQSNSWRSGLWISLVACGCGGGDLSEYRPVQKSVTTQETASTVASSPDPQANSSGAAADERTAMMSVPSDRASLPPVVAVENPNPNKVELLVPHKTFPRDRITKALRVTFDDLNLLTVLNMDPVTEDVETWMPDWMTSLNGQQVRVRGFIYPSFFGDGIEKFVLLRDDKECCYGPGAKIYDNMDVRLKPGVTTTFTIRPIDVVGRFRIKALAAGGSMIGLYYIEDATVVGH